ncbi:MAG: hypothetical protein ACD_62C00419G0001 [uncultured bacterium]|nr:MAG: hypothetical protein ACD_62C00419G0001 [uncultured bacterium]
MTDSELISVEHVLEGGSIDVNGRGTLITSTDCLLNDNRQMGVSRQKIEELFHRYLGIRQVIWAQGQIKGDDTDGHIDDAVRFVGPRQVVCIAEKRAQDVNYESLRCLKESLAHIKDQDGEPIAVAELPMPNPVEFEGQRMPASYANFLITNKKILVPVYGCDQDQEALKIIGSFFPDRKAVGIDCCALVTGFGSIHCVSMHVPV